MVSLPISVSLDTGVQWKQLSFVLIVIVSLQSVLLLYKGLAKSSLPIFDTTHDTASERIHSIANLSGTCKSSSLLPWNELPIGGDGEILDNLSDAQCQYAFPDAYKDVDRAKEYWRSRNHTIDGNDTSIAWQKEGGFRVLIHNNNLRVLEGYNSLGGGRGKMVLFQLHRALESASAAGELLPTVEFSVSTSDITNMPTDESDTLTTWTWNRLTNEKGHERGHDRHWLIPNYNMWVRDTRMAAKQLDAPFTSKIPKLIWRGATWVAPELRGKLLQVTANQSWADTAMVDNEHPENWVTNVDLCKYAMTVHTEGVSYSGRLKWLTDCNSLLFIHDLLWDMHYLHLLEPSGPNQNYVPVKRDWSDLEEKVKYYLDHPEEAERIINNMLATFRDRYLTRAALSCYTRRLIQGYAEVSWTPETQRPASDPKKQLRGISYEMFVVDMHDFDEASA